MTANTKNQLDYFKPKVNDKWSFYYLIERQNKRITYNIYYFMYLSL